MKFPRRSHTHYNIFTTLVKCKFKVEMPGFQLHCKLVAIMSHSEKLTVVWQLSLVSIWSLMITRSLDSLKHRITHDCRRSPDCWKVFPHNLWWSPNRWKVFPYNCHLINTSHTGSHYFKSEKPLISSETSLYLWLYMIGNNETRKRKEQRLIFKLGTLAPNGINERFSFA